MLEAEKSDGDIWRTWLPFSTLAVSLLLVVAARNTPVPQQDFGIILLAAAVAGAWVGFWVTLHPEWQSRRGLMMIFFVGLLGCNLFLVWASPLFGFFVWTGYIFTGYALAGWWRIVGAVPVAAISALSQVGGIPTVTISDDGAAFYGAAVLINMVIAGIMIFVENRTEQKAIKREQTLEELAATNRLLQEALRENAGLHAQLLVQAREAGVLDERQRMAGEIHDVLAQGLTGIVTQLEAAESHPEQRAHHLASAKRLAREGLAEARRSVQALRPHHLDGAALPEALGEVVESWSELTGVRAELITTGSPRRLLPEIEASLLRTAQESLANVAKHAGAARVGLTLSYMEDVVILDVRDDGAGFDPERPPEPSENGGFGLRAMRERLSRIAGTLDVESEPGAGTAISACVPALAIGGTT